MNHHKTPAIERFNAKFLVSETAVRQPSPSRSRHSRRERASRLRQAYKLRRMRAGAEQRRLARSRRAGGTAGDRGPNLDGGSEQ